MQRKITGFDLNRTAVNSGKNLHQKAWNVDFVWQRC